MDQFADLLPGESIPAFPSKPWNQMLRKLDPQAADAFDGSTADGPIEISVQNKTNATLDRFAILSVDLPVITKTNDENAFLVRDLMKGYNPTATSVIAITQTTLGTNEIGKARIAGLVRVKVDVTSLYHEWASPTTSRTQLTSGDSGPFRILALATDDPGPRTTGVQYAVGVLRNLGEGIKFGISTQHNVSGTLPNNGIYTLEFTKTGYYLFSYSFWGTIAHAGVAGYQVGLRFVDTAGTATIGASELYGSDEWQTINTRNAEAAGTYYHDFRGFVLISVTAATQETPCEVRVDLTTGSAITDALFTGSITINSYNNAQLIRLSDYGTSLIENMQVSTTPVTGGASGEIFYNSAGVLESASDTRVVADSLELKLASDRWIAFSKGSF